MKTYNINDLAQFNKDILTDTDKDCMLQMWGTAKNIINDLERFYNDDFTDEERENEEDNLWAYFDDVLDINYTINSDFTYKGCELCVAWGGPGIWIDTNNGVIKCRWWGSSFDVCLDGDLCNLIDGIFSDYYEMSRY